MAAHSAESRPTRDGWRGYRSRHRGDLVALTILTASLAAVVGFLVAGGTLVGLDAAVFFYPMYTAVGDRLADGALPLWNPWQRAGAPLAADPQSGWLYLPVMLLFTLLPVALAAPVLVTGHLAVAGFGAYALARTLGLSPPGALVAGIAFSQSGWYLSRVASVTSDTGAVAWLPVALLGVELATRQDRRLPRLVGWGLAGFALSQSQAVWLGQGSYYVSLATAAYIAYRTLVQPTTPLRSLPARLVDLALHGGAIVLIAFGLSAGALLPRLELLAVSNLADGYAAIDGTRGGWTTEQTGERLLGRTSYYVGGATFALAAAGLGLAGRRYAAPYWAALIATCLFLARSDRTALHDALGALLPRFADVQSSLPERVTMVAYLGAALLAGAAVAEWPVLMRPSRHRLLALAGTGAALALALWLDRRDEELSIGTFWPVAAITALVALTLVGRRRLPTGLAPALVCVVLLCDLLPTGRALVLTGEGGLRHYREDLSDYYGSTPAADFLRSQEATPYRYVGYDPTLVSRDAEGVLYRRHFGNSWTRALLVNNRATILRIYDVQGQDTPAQIQRYVELLEALNGQPQDYHEAAIYPPGLESPLLDLLNVRYVVVPNAPAEERPDLAALEQIWPVVYEDRRVKILENPEALPRAWLVHNARRAAPGEALALLASGTVDPRMEALLEEDPPPLAPAADMAADVATVLRLEPERIAVQTRSDAPALLVLSEIAYPAWRAYLDGEPVPLFVANHALRAVAVPAGQHVVELRYESTALRRGLALGATTVGLLGGGILAAWYVERRRPASPGLRSDPDAEDRSVAPGRPPRGWSGDRRR